MALPSPDSVGFDDTVEELLPALVDLSRSGQLDTPVLELLASVCADVSGCGSAGVLVLEGVGCGPALAGTDEVARSLLGLVVQGVSSPAGQALEQLRPVLVDDLRAPCLRWPQHAQAAELHRVRAVHVLPVLSGGTAAGVLSVYRSQPGPLSDAALRALRVLAALAGTGLGHLRAHADNARTVAQLQHALDARIPVEQAKGALAALTGLSVDDAFTVLRHYARENHRKVAEVARAVLDGSLPAARIVAHGVARQRRRRE